MPTLNISLTEETKEFIEQQVGSGRYHDASEYFNDLVRNDEKQQQLEAMLLQGIQSGDPAEMTAADWEEIRKNGSVLLDANRRSRLHP
jgi:antitoxin ParD1/3/4